MKPSKPAGILADWMNPRTSFHRRVARFERLSQLPEATKGRFDIDSNPPSGLWMALYTLRTPSGLYSVIARHKP